MDIIETRFYDPCENLIFGGSPQQDKHHRYKSPMGVILGDAVLRMLTLHSISDGLGPTRYEQALPEPPLDSHQ